MANKKTERIKKLEIIAERTGYAVSTIKVFICRPEFAEIVTDNRDEITDIEKAVELILKLKYKKDNKGKKTNVC